MSEQMTVRRIEPQTECTRMVVYGDDPHYQVIADLPSPGIKVGDVIEYEPYGINFGWLVTHKEDDDAKSAEAFAERAWSGHE